MKTVLQEALTPVAMAIFPVLSLYSGNTSVVRVSEVLPSLCLVALIAFLIYLLLALGLKSPFKSSLIVTGFTFIFFLYGAFFPPERPITNFGTEVDAEPFSLLPTVAYMMLLAGYCGLLLVILVTKRQLEKPARVVKIFVLSLLVVGLVGIGIGLVSSYRGLEREQLPATVIASNATGTKLPDIYYIVLDGYGRQDVLSTMYGVDNSAFLDGLRARGFFIASESNSNYTHTLQSLASSLNFTYLDHLPGKSGTLHTRVSLDRLIQENRIGKILKSSGYTFVEINSDVTTSANLEIADITIDKTGISTGEFTNSLILRTPLVLYDWIEVFSPQRLHAAHVQFQLRSLETLPRYDRPIFLFTHIVSPHPPFVFDSKGEITPYASSFNLNDCSFFMGTLDQYRTGYVQQMSYVNGEILAAIDHILSSYAPEDRPIIVLQGDHGPGMKVNAEATTDSCLWERVSILNAYLVPEDVRAQLYESISPVNTFPTIVNGVLKTDIERLPDESYFAPYSKPLDFTLISKERIATDREREQGAP